jgi:MFS family permease
MGVVSACFYGGTMWRRVPPLMWTVLGASLMTTLGTSPVFLLGSQSVLIRSDLGFDERRFGIAVGAFFAAAAVSALLVGRVADRLGRRASTVAAGLLAAAGGCGLAWAAYSWQVLLAAMVVLGIANAACQVTANLSMARVVPPHRRGLGFGVKQSAIPLSVMVAGLAVPTLSTALGWRATFVATGLAGLVTAAVGLRLSGSAGDGVDGSGTDDRPPMPALVTTMVAIALASAAANSLGSFVASWGFEVGLTPGQAGILMSTGSALNIVVRVVSGHRADRRYGRNLPVVATQMLVGAVALLALSVPSPVAVVPAALVAFALGWSWPGLALYAVVRIGRDAPATASGVVQAGAFAGGATGPLLFGLVVDAAGYETAWRFAAAAFLLAAALVLLARRMFVADLAARPPRVVIGYGGGREMPARVTTARTESGDGSGHDPR